ncbi:bsl6049 [Bradyrhizobium diazoefficiens USDA 110]|uniref:Bsl6049 protein n=1 Tax=Bradyrhizobium diazoefficiens (strain JCM 10833 / BCRC 13528 / IAM 13628 / NBRC 14792 / USDA 110) TaxID=224911 RepID=Q89HE2_BRADU|nr:hypothetical protein Bdiaspc4_31895 [Bradyrhizobium diazoefficiens]BAC51314.1 bsl6049 [Bradyrhizobium diazoefficiens USDA 110]
MVGWCWRRRSCDLQNAHSIPLMCLLRPPAMSAIALLGPMAAPQVEQNVRCRLLAHLGPEVRCANAPLSEAERTSYEVQRKFMSARPP